MQIQLQTNKTRYEFNETIRCVLTRTDVEPHETIDWMNGQDASRHFLRWEIAA